MDDWLTPLLLVLLVLVLVLVLMLVLALVSTVLLVSVYTSRFRRFLVGRGIG